MDHRAAAEYAARRLRETAGDVVEQVILYGSVARGEAGPESDVDLLVVTRDYRKASRALLPIRGRLLSEGVLLSVLLLTPEQLDEMKRLRFSFYTAVMSEGELLVA